MHAGGLGGGEIGQLGGVGGEIVEFGAVGGLIFSVGEDQLRRAVDDPAPAEAGGGDLEVDEVVGEALAVDRLPRGDSDGIEEIDAGHGGGGGEAGGAQESGHEVDGLGEVG